jgi:putative membrane protein
MNRLLSFLGTAAALWIAVWIVNGFEFDGEWWQFLIVAVIVALANTFVKPILTFFSFPLILLTLGLFLIIVNALVLQLAVWLSGPDVLNLGLTSTGFWWTTFWASIVVTIAGWIIGALVPDRGSVRRMT